MGRPGVVIALLLVAAAATASTTGVSSLTSTRSLSGDTVPDERAYLGVERTDVSVTSNRTNATPVRLTNGLGEWVSVRAGVQVGDGPVTILAVDPPDALAVGERAGVTLDLRCESRGTTTARIAVTTEGETTRVTLTRRVQIDCV